MALLISKTIRYYTNDLENLVENEDEMYISNGPADYLMDCWQNVTKWRFVHSTVMWYTENNYSVNKKKGTPKNFLVVIHRKKCKGKYGNRHI